PRPAPRLRHRPANRADQRRSAQREPGHPLPGAAQAGTGRLDRLGVGPVREQPEGALLSADPGGAKAAARRDRGLEPDRRDHRPILRGEGGRSAMRPLRRWLRRLSAGTTRRAAQERLSAEIEDHIERQAADYVRAGLPPGEARRQALLKFGGVEATKERW